MKANLFYFLLLLSLLLGLPLLGALLAGNPVMQYLEFPPTTRYVEHAGFSLPLFIGLASFEIPLYGLLVIHFWTWHRREILRRRETAPTQNDKKSNVILGPNVSESGRKTSFPWWGWAGVVLNLAAWCMAWTRFEWFTAFQVFTFSPLWFGFIIVINALTFMRSGQCMLKNRPAYFLLLFPVSAGFWWFFEYLNRFVQNWSYVGVDHLTPLQYFAFATLSFSTVLPAVMGTYEFFQTIFGKVRLRAAIDNRVKTRGLAIAALIVFGWGLAGIGIRPDLLFPLLWLAPLFILAALEALKGQDNWFFAPALGNLHRVYLLALSALVCGFFWEMWNFNSYAKWIYALPYVNILPIFEMPLLGYAGYLPFGLECGMIANIVGRMMNRNRDSQPI